MTNTEDYRSVETTGLRALAWVVCDERLATRLLALTGMDAATLRARAAQPSTLAAVIGFLADHEPDLIACAKALDMTPEAVVKAGILLARGVSAGE